jgi:hypothetical protein
MADAQPDRRRLVLHVGCGPAHPEALHIGFRTPEWREVRLDVDPLVKPDIVASITAMPQVVSGSVDAVWSSHNLEHLARHEVPVALAEFHRVLRPGGFVFIRLPDLQKAAALLAADGPDAVAYQSKAGPITALDIVYGYARFARESPYMVHKTGFSAGTLETALRAAGFRAVAIEKTNWDLWARGTR